MASITLGPEDNFFVSDLIPIGSETANSISAGLGNDTIFGNQFVDFIFGEGGDDSLSGEGGDDVLLGGTGNDTLVGGTGNDFLIGEAGRDILIGQSGSDRLRGGQGDDVYIYTKAGGGGLDIIADDLSAAGSSGFGGGNDSLQLSDITLANLVLYRDSDSFGITDTADAADGIANTGVLIERFFLGGNNIVETLITADGFGLDISVLV